MVSSTDSSSNIFRTHQEMDAVYQKLGVQGGAEQPYILDYKRDGQRLLFFGSLHSANPEHPQVGALDKSWQGFVESPNPKKHVFTEGSLRQVSGKTKEQAIFSDAESGQICWLAQGADIPITSPEPDRKEEIDYLHEKGFSYEQIITYYFSRQMLQWINYDHENQPDWRVYADRVQLYKAVHDWGGLDLSLESMLAIYKEQLGKEFSIDDKQTLYNLSDPTQNPVSSASGLLRDKKLYSAIEDKWQSGYDVFVVYGSGHAIVLEPALEKLASAKEENNLRLPLARESGI